jgi:hypothetical protein
VRGVRHEGSLTPAPTLDLRPLRPSDRASPGAAILATPCHPPGSYVLVGSGVDVLCDGAQPGAVLLAEWPPHHPLLPLDGVRVCYDAAPVDLAAGSPTLDGVAFPCATMQAVEALHAWEGPIGWVRSPLRLRMPHGPLAYMAYAFAGDFLVAAVTQIEGWGEAPFRAPLRTFARVEEIAWWVREWRRTGSVPSREENPHR